MKKLFIPGLALIIAGSMSITLAQETQDQVKSQDEVEAAQFASTRLEEARVRAGDYTAILKSYETKVRAIEEQIRFQTDNGELTEQESEEKMALVQQAKIRVEAMKAAVDNFKKLIKAE